MNRKNNRVIGGDLEEQQQQVDSTTAPTTAHQFADCFTGNHLVTNLVYSSHRYLGQSACYMSLAIGNHAHGDVVFDVIDTWALLGAPAKLNWVPEADAAAVARLGANDFQLAWGHFVKTFGSWRHITSSVRGSSIQKAVLNRYEDVSVDFLYLDTAHGKQTPMELRLWWPKVRPGGRMCGDDYDRDDVKGALSGFFIGFCDDELCTAAALPRAQWCVDKPASTEAPMRVEQ